MWSFRISDLNAWIHQVSHKGSGFLNEKMRTFALVNLVYVKIKWISSSKGTQWSHGGLWPPCTRYTINVWGIKPSHRGFWLVWARLGPFLPSCDANVGNHSDSLVLRLTNFLQFCESIHINGVSEDTNQAKHSHFLQGMTLFGRICYLVVTTFLKSTLKS